MSTVRRFFSEHPVDGNTIRITGDEFHHIKNVNRAKPGDPLEVIDGKGSLYFCEIKNIKSDSATAQIKIKKFQEKPPTTVIIAPSLLKQRPMNLLIEKLTELGVDQIRPVIFQRTDETYSTSKLKKWERIAGQSLKVNKRLWITDILPPISIPQLIRLAPSFKSRILLDISGGTPSLFTWLPPVIAVIGPPGDFMDQERDDLVNNGFISTSINECVLKSETAALSIAALLKQSAAASR